MKYFAVIDTNVLVSALLASLKSKDTPPTQVLDCIFDGVVIPVYNDEIIGEYSEVLHRAKFGFPDPSITDVLQAMISLGIESERVASADETCGDPDDVVFYEVALSVDESFLVTGNIKHFPTKPFIVTPARMIEIIKSEDAEGQD